MPGRPRADTELLFVDSVYLIALYSPGDDWRRAAIAAFRQLDAQQTFYTSDGVLLEMLAHFSRERRLYRQHLVNQIRGIRADPRYRVIPRRPALTEAALDLYAGEFADSTLSLQDCAAIVIMREYGITSILTADQEFTRAGFTPLLRRYLD